MNGFGRSHRKDAAKRRRPAFALIALLAVFLQAFVIETHVHAPFAVSVEQSDSVEHQVSIPGEHRVACSLCQTLASGGAAPLPATTALIANEAATNEALIALASAPRQQSHAWQSRAPPLFL